MVLTCRAIKSYPLASEKVRIVGDVAVSITGVSLESVAQLRNALALLRVGQKCRAASVAKRREAQRDTHHQPTEFA
jgi:hypothetical protein